ncbi:MAG TPA: FHA domain-containing protein [Gaiellaceae bacterium]|nr:FHA domain-containing protein [Gaiellaceae bacterium]
MSHVYCPECGFQNLESANYCSRCGALLVTEADVDVTMTFSAEELEEERSEALEDLGVEGPALVVRSGGGRTGEQFPLDRTQTTIGRSPDCDIFLDDVTVSRRHAIVARGPAAFTIEDLGSLNGTFLNRRRIERADLENGDEVQIGKYRLTFLER